MTLHVEVRADPDALRALRPDWDALWDDDETASLFHRSEFLLSWWDEFGEGLAPYTIVMRRGAAPRGLAFTTVADGVLRFLGDAEVTDYLGPIGRDREAIAEGFVRAISDIDGWTVAELHGLSADTGWSDALARAAKDAEWTVEEQAQDVCPRIVLPGDHEAYLASLPGKLRHEIRRKARKLEREAGSYRVRLTTPETLEADFERFYALHRSSDGPKGKFLHEGMASFFTRLARAFAERGWFRLSWLEVDGTAVAGVWSFAERGVWSVYNSAYDHAKRDLAPGMVLMGETIRLATAAGCHTFDLLRGDEPYKYRFGATAVPLAGLTIRRR